MTKTVSKFFTFLLGVTVILNSCSNENKNNKEISYKDKIQQAFNDWKAKVINEGLYAPADSCNTFYFLNRKKNEKLDEGLGLPDSTKFHYLFVDINNDKQPDALITFHSKCCTCSDTTGKIVPQMQVIIISSSNGYITNDAFFNHLFPDSLNINIDIDSASVNKFYGTYFKIDKQDTSVDQYQKSISIAYDTKEMQFIKRKKNKRME